MYKYIHIYVQMHVTWFCAGAIQGSNTVFRCSPSLRFAPSLSKSGAPVQYVPGSRFMTVISKLGCQCRRWVAQAIPPFYLRWHRLASPSHLFVRSNDSSKRRSTQKVSKPENRAHNNVTMLNQRICVHILKAAI